MSATVPGFINQIHEMVAVSVYVAAVLILIVVVMALILAQKEIGITEWISMIVLRRHLLLIHEVIFSMVILNSTRNHASSCRTASWCMMCDWMRGGRTRQRIQVIRTIWKT